MSDDIQYIRSTLLCAKKELLGSSVQCRGQSSVCCSGAIVGTWVQGSESSRLSVIYCILLYMVLHLSRNKKKNKSIKIQCSTMFAVE